MNLHRIIPFSLVLVLLLGACQSEHTDGEGIAVENLYDIYGEAITDEGAVPVQAVVAEWEQYLGQVVKIEGTVAAVCQMKGCWLTLQTNDGNNIRILVDRTETGDYAFTVPTDISGRRVVVQGTLAETVLTEDEQQHLAEDTDETVDPDTRHSQTELQMRAQGVLVEKG